jgi:ferrous iron transport protein A
MMPLPFASIGEENLVMRVGGTPEVKKHLENLGFVPGTPVTIVNTLNGNVIVRIRDTRVALDGKMAEKIMI